MLSSPLCGCYACGVQGRSIRLGWRSRRRLPISRREQVGQSVEIHFTLPELATDGERLTKPLEIEILRATAPQCSGLAKLPEPAVWIHLDPEEWTPYAQGKEFSYSAHLTEQEYHEWRGPDGGQWCPHPDSRIPPPAARERSFQPGGRIHLRRFKACREP